jgi:hypothetical protein
MSFLGKQNPRATKRSVALWSAVGGVIGAAVAVIGCRSGGMPDGALYFMIPWMALSCAVGFGAIEWQMPWSEEPKNEQRANREREVPDGDQETRFRP